MTNYDSIEALVSAIEKRSTAIAQRVLEKYAAPIAEEIVRQHIISDIYNAYTPKENGWVDTKGNRVTYQRRHDLENSLYYQFNGVDEILITSNAKANRSVGRQKFRHRYPGSFLELLESGNMGMWRGGFPRPAIAKAQAEIDGSTAIQKAIQYGINKELSL